MKKNSMLKKFVAALLATATVASAGIGASAAVITDFTDVNPKAWYYEAVEYAVDNSLFSGTSKTTFSPGGAMTRGMFVTVLGRKAGIDESQYLAYRFTDVKKGEYYAPYVEWAARYGIVSGISDTTFAPNKSITREQMAAILYRYAKATDNDTEYTTGKYTSFPDLGSVSGFAVEPLMWATDKGIIKGSDGKLNPKGTATRAQVAQVFLTSKDILTKTEVTAEPIPVPETKPSTDSKAHPNNIFNVFAREFSTANDWQVSDKSRMDQGEQAQLISLLKGKTGNAVWNEIALNGMTTGQVGATRDAYFVNIHDGNAYLNKATSIEKVSERILKAMERAPDVKYFCVTLADAQNSTEGVQKDYNYQLYFINTPDAFVNSSDDALLAEVKRLVAERLPSGFVWSENALKGGWSTVPGAFYNEEEAKEMGASSSADAIASFMVTWLTKVMGTDREGATRYYIGGGAPAEGWNNPNELVIYLS